MKKNKVKKSVFDKPKKSNFITIKTSLKSILKNYEQNFPVINNLVVECNEIVIRTYQFMRLFLIWKYNNRQELPIIDKNTILYFLRACGNRDNRGKKSENKKFEQELNDFYKKEFEPLINKPKFNLKSKTHIIPYLAIQINTAFFNNIKEHFITRIRRFMNIMCPFKIEKEEKVEFNKVKNNILLDKPNEIPNKFKEFASNIKNEYLPKEYIISYGYDVKVNPSKYLFYTIKMNEEIERRNEELKDEEKQLKIKKLFQPLSLRTSIVPNYITLDASAVLDIFKEKGESKLGFEVNKNKELIWSKIFKTNKKDLKMKNYEFKTIQTDGIGVSICFQKIGKKYKEKEQNEDNEQYLTELNEKDLFECKNKKLVAIDPNKNSLVYLMDEKHNKLRYTASQRRIESMKKTNRNILKKEKEKKENNCIVEAETELSKFNCKTTNYEQFKNYIVEKTKLNEKVKEFYNKILWRKLKWRSWIYTRKSEDKFLNKIESKFGKEKELLLCYGNWSNTKQMKHIMPTKGIGLRRIIAKKFNVVLIDEFRTSKLCHKCEEVLTNYKNIHRLLVCSHCKCNGLESKNITFINRDINACMNILNISKCWLETKIRPKRYCRDFDLDKGVNDKVINSDEKLGR